MKYKIIVDKQSRTNPSADKKEYMINIEELRTTGSVSDSLIITKNEAYVLRRLKLTEYHVLEELENPIKQTLADVKIELFEGDNYIYLIDMTGNKFYAEYLIKNDFTDNYVIKSEMNSAINQSATEIELTVNQRLTGYSTTEQMNSAITIKANEISSEVGKKVGSNEIISKINQSAEAVSIDAKKVNINGVISANKNFQIDTAGNMQCNNAKFTGGSIILDSSNKSTYSNAVFKISNNDGSKAYILSNAMSLTGDSSAGIPAELTLSLSETDGPGIHLDSFNLESITVITSKEVSAPIITQTSLESKKKNFSLMNDSALEIIKGIDIYRYNLKVEKDTDKKHLGFVIGDSYNYSKEVTSIDNTGVDTYSFVSLCCKAIQEQQKQIKELKQRILNLEEGAKNGNT